MAGGKGGGVAQPGRRRGDMKEEKAEESLLRRGDRSPRLRDPRGDCRPPDAADTSAAAASATSAGTSGRVGEHGSSAAADAASSAAAARAGAVLPSAGLAALVGVLRSGAASARLFVGVLLALPPCSDRKCRCHARRRTVDPKPSGCVLQQRTNEPALSHVTATTLPAYEAVACERRRICLQRRAPCGRRQGATHP